MVQVSLAEEDRDLAVVKAPVVIDAGAAGTAAGTITSVQAVTSASSSGQGGGNLQATTTYLVTIAVDPGKKGSAAAKRAAAIQAQADGSPVTVSFADQKAKVLERRSEIGLRRALGATRRQMMGQFLPESITLSLTGGFAGAVLGVIVVAAYATSREWPVDIPAWVLPAALAPTMIVGALAGLFPAARAARIDPAQTLSGA